LPELPGLPNIAGIDVKPATIANLSNHRRGSDFQKVVGTAVNPPGNSQSLAILAFLAILAAVGTGFVLSLHFIR